ncbi:MAG: nucleotide-binding protein [Mycetocola sp.]
MEPNTRSESAGDASDPDTSAVPVSAFASAADEFKAFLAKSRDLLDADADADAETKSGAEQTSGNDAEPSGNDAADREQAAQREDHNAHPDVAADSETAANQEMTRVQAQVPHSAVADHDSDDISALSATGAEVGLGVLPARDDASESDSGPLSFAQSEPETSNVLSPTDDNQRVAEPLRESANEEHPLDAAIPSQPRPSAVPEPIATRSEDSSDIPVDVTPSSASLADADADAASKPANTRNAEATVPVASRRVSSTQSGLSGAGTDVLAPAPRSTPLPQSGWRRAVRRASFGSIRPQESARDRVRRETDELIATPLQGATRFVPVLSRKGGVGKTTVTSLLGMALATGRADRIVAVDANPDRGTLSERVVDSPRFTARDVIKRAAGISGFTELSELVARDQTRLDVIASDTDPHVSEAFNDADYETIAELCERFYSLVLTDCGTGIVHSAMRATLDRADTVVIVSGGSVDEARLATETLDWLETNGFAALARRAVVVLNSTSAGAPVVKLDELERHFAPRVARVVRIPYDAKLAAGTAINYSELKPRTQQAARTLSAAIVEALR